MQMDSRMCECGASDWEYCQTYFTDPPQYCHVCNKCERGKVFDVQILPEQSTTQSQHSLFEEKDDRPHLYVSESILTAVCGPVSDGKDNRLDEFKKSPLYQRVGREYKISGHTCDFCGNTQQNGYVSKFSYKLDNETIQIHATTHSLGMKMVIRDGVKLDVCFDGDCAKTYAETPYNITIMTEEEMRISDASGAAMQKKLADEYIQDFARRVKRWNASKK